MSPHSAADKLDKLKKIPSLFDIETFAPRDAPKDQDFLDDGSPKDEPDNNHSREQSRDRGSLLVHHQILSYPL